MKLLPGDRSRMKLRLIRLNTMSSGGLTRTSSLR